MVRLSTKYFAITHKRSAFPAQRSIFQPCVDIFPGTEHQRMNLKDPLPILGQLLAGLQPLPPHGSQSGPPFWHEFILDDLLQFSKHLHDDHRSVRPLVRLSRHGRQFSVQEITCRVYESLGLTEILQIHRSYCTTDLHKYLFVLVLEYGKNCSVESTILRIPWNYTYIPKARALIAYLRAICFHYYYYYCMN